MLLHKSKGPLRYSMGNAGFKLIVEVDPGIASLCKALLPKSVILNPTRYSPHISVIRKEIPVLLEHWGKYEGQMAEFEYTNFVYSSKIYWWINVFSKQLENIRLELGLPVSSPYTRPPEGYEKCFHSTIGNTKSL